MKGRPNSNYILQVMRDGDMSDPWGTAMAMAFAVAECLTVVGADVPAELGYQPSPFVVVQSEDDYEPESYEEELVWGHLQSEVRLGQAVEEVQFAGRCLSRYIDWLRAVGRDY